jgi:SAM-dependent methyltransferase
MNHGEERERWDRGYAKSEGLFFRLGRTHHNAPFREIVRSIDRIVRDRFADLRQLNILELGGGASDWLVHFGRAYGCRLWSIDYSREGCARLKEKMDKWSLPCTILERDFFDLKTGEISAPIDLVFSFGLLEHFEDRTRIYKLAESLLSGPGLFIAVVPNLNALNLRWVNFANPALMDWHYRLDLPALRDEMAARGYLETGGRYLGGLRLFAPGRSSLLACLKRGLNGIGEILSRFANLSSRAWSPYIMIWGTMKGGAPPVKTGEPR